jgi:prepilin-type N-terminal cleavage/methylation domain-containing protein
MSKAFTLIEILVAIAITAILSGIVLFSITQYVNRGKDSNISANLAILVPAGETFYSGNNDSYEGFCESSVVKNAILQMPLNSNGNCYSSENLSGLCCKVDDIFFDKWAACAKSFSNHSNAFCVDSRGIKKQIESRDCSASIIECL